MTCPECGDGWSGEYELASGLVVQACDSCGRAEIDNTSVDGIEAHIVSRYRDSDGAFQSPSENT